MDKISCVWLGPPGTHSIAGDVATDRKLTLTADDFAMLLGHGLVKADEKPGKKTKKTEK